MENYSDYHQPKTAIKNLRSQRQRFKINPNSSTNDISYDRDIDSQDSLTKLRPPISKPKLHGLLLGHDLFGSERERKRFVSFNNTSSILANGGDKIAEKSVFTNRIKNINIESDQEIGDGLGIQQYSSLSIISKQSSKLKPLQGIRNKSKLAVDTKNSVNSISTLNLDEGNKSTINSEYRVAKKRETSLDPLDGSI